ncbi:MAG: hypothetical protein WCL43_07530 [Chlorobium sp.]
MKKITFASIASLCMVPAAMFWSQDSQAIPAFARKYQTSCYTCHSGFPTRNAFGEAFRNNGYRWPGGDDEEFTKQEQLKIGTDGWKKVFPESPWPSDIPNFGPLAVWVRGNLVNYSEQVNSRTTGKATVQQTFNYGNGPLGATSLFFGGTLGDNLSVLGTYDPTAGLARGHFVWAFQPGLNLSVGNFFSDFNFGNAIGTNNAVNPQNPVPNGLGTGAELVYTRERMKITAGLTEAGTAGAPTNTNSFDDIRYVRAKYKFGGAGLLSGAGGTYGNEFVGLDNHIAVGASLVSMKPGVTGLNAPHLGETLIPSVDVTGNYGDFTGGVAYSKDQDLGYNNYVIQTGYFIYPWLKAAVNYTSLQDGLNPAIASSITAWLRANASLALTWTHPTREFTYTQATNAKPVAGDTAIDIVTLAVGFAL